MLDLNDQLNYVDVITNTWIFHNILNCPVGQPRAMDESSFFMLGLCMTLTLKL